MDDHFDQIVWSPKSEEDLDAILKYYQEFNEETARSKVIQIIMETEKLIFSKQYQIDEYDPLCLRLFVAQKFRVVYRIVDRIILITRVYPTQKNPKGLAPN